jgi:hypothetical protein
MFLNKEAYDIMTIVLVSFAVGLICLIAGFFIGRRNATYILAQAMALVDDSEHVVEQLKGMAEKLKDGGEE